MINVAQTFQNTINEIFFYSFSTARTFSFKAFLTDYGDQYNTNWTPQEIYGRMDPVFTYKNTIRKISLAFDVPSYDVEEAEGNAQTADLLIRSLYPVYRVKDGGKGTALLSSPPLFKIKFANLIMNATKDVKSDDPFDSGLLGWIDGFNFKPELESGFFVEPSVIKNSNHKVYPKLFKVNFGFNVIHEHDLGTKIEKGLHVSRMTINGKKSDQFSHKYLRVNDPEQKEETIPNPPSEITGTAQNSSQEARQAPLLRYIKPGDPNDPLALDPNSGIRVVAADFSKMGPIPQDSAGKRYGNLNVLVSVPRK